MLVCTDCGTPLEAARQGRNDQALLAGSLTFLILSLVAGVVFTLATLSERQGSELQQTSGSEAAPGESRD
jgi:hypothetical protein